MEEVNPSRASMNVRWDTGAIPIRGKARGEGTGEQRGREGDEGGSECGLLQGMSLRVIVKRIRAQCSEIIAMLMSSGVRRAGERMMGGGDKDTTHFTTHNDATKAESNGCEVNSPTGLKPAPRTSEAHRGKYRTGTERTGQDTWTNNSRGMSWSDWCVCAMLQANQVICLVYLIMIIMNAWMISRQWERRHRRRGVAISWTRKL